MSYEAIYLGISLIYMIRYSQHGAKHIRTAHEQTREARLLIPRFCVPTSNAVTEDETSVQRARFVPNTTILLVGMQTLVGIRRASRDASGANQLTKD